MQLEQIRCNCSATAVPNPQSTIPEPQSPIRNPQSRAPRQVRVLFFYIFSTAPWLCVSADIVWRANWTTGHWTGDTGHWTTAGCGEVDEIAMAI